MLVHPDVDDWLDDAPADVEQQVRKKRRDSGDRPEFLLDPLRGRDTYKLAAGDYRAEIDWDEDLGDCSSFRPVTGTGLRVVGSTDV